MIFYRVVQEHLFLADYGDYISYGIDACQEEHGIFKTLASVSDVFLQKEDAEHFTKLCNDGGLSLLHFRDAIEDAVAHVT